LNIPPILLMDELTPIALVAPYFLAMFVQHPLSLSGD